MDDRTQPARDNAAPNRTAPSAPTPNTISQGNGRRDARIDERASANRSPSGKPALTDRERSERWPVD